MGRHTTRSTFTCNCSAVPCARRDGSSRDNTVLPRTKPCLVIVIYFIVDVIPAEETVVLAHGEGLATTCAVLSSQSQHLLQR